MSYVIKKSGSNKSCTFSLSSITTQTLGTLHQVVLVLCLPQKFAWLPCSYY